MTPPAAAAPGKAGAAQEGSKDRILSATAALVRERGLDGTTIAAVCARSGLPVSSIYWHFEDKDALFAEVLHTSYTSWLAAAPLGEGAAGSRDLAEVLESAIRSLQGMPDFLVVGMQLLLERRDQYERARVLFSEIRAQIAGMITAWLLEALRPHPDPLLAQDLSRLVVAFSDGALVAAQVDEGFDVEVYVQLFLGTFVRAARRHSERRS
ncbi:TetR/AcrR family transcriptional regulator [Nocardioides sp. cx-173]|uniref:TetR/AcrR family transcriptional regulator n=1 Tax=Nocardioides sp. cx-173 TaxID=2898796 RepID=UPI001E3E33B5|nr:TetR/AcrR family transcriptional regulator [Nocardioides sp. cx-173]MCD4526610.1 TetR/AcrR family transcriptional regulator [Nocardioides sp. cx-173]UGB40703.1 TetR/AcrR family transcriptional regulator [Nocardioides sp. cx-173]